MSTVQGMPVPEGLATAVTAVVVIGIRAWAQVQVAREQRRERENELWAALVAGAAVERRNGGTGRRALPRTPRADCCGAPTSGTRRRR
ncbi:hypothetical protein [Streptomyces sp. NPDC001492]